MRMNIPSALRGWISTASTRNRNGSSGAPYLTKRSASYYTSMAAGNR